MVRFIALYSIFAARSRLPPGSRVPVFQVYQVESSILVRSTRYWFLLLRDLKNVCVLPFMIDYVQCHRIIGVVNSLQSLLCCSYYFVAVINSLKSSSR